MMTTKTLIGLACLIANKGELNTAPLEAQLTSVEKIQVERVIASGICLPENMERLLNRTQERMRKGELIQTSSGPGSPCDPCY